MGKIPSLRQRGDTIPASETHKLVLMNGRVVSIVPRVKSVSEASGNKGAVEITQFYLGRSEMSILGKLVCW